MTERITKFVPLWMLTGVGLGIVCGYYLPQVSLALDFVGQLYLGGLKLLIIPLIVAGVISGINGFGLMSKAGRFAGRVLLYFVATTAVAVLIGVVMVLVIGPGRAAPAYAHGVTTVDWSSFSDILSGLIPGNLVQAVSEGKYLGVVLLALFLGGMLTAMGVKGRSAVSFFKSIHEGLLRIVPFVVLISPIGLFSLVGSSIAGSPSVSAHMSMAGSYTLTVILALAIHLLLVLPLALLWLGRRSPVGLYSDLIPAFLTAFGTSSSVAAFPVTYSCLADRSKIDPRATSMVLPLGMVINLGGTAIVMVVATLFAAQAAGVSVGIGPIVLVALMAILLSFGTAGIPMTVLLAAPVLFSVVGLSAGQAAGALGIIVVFDWLVDRLRAMVNLGSDAVGAAVLAESFELKTARRTGRERPPARTRTPRAGGAGREPRSERSGGRGGGRRTDRTGDTSRPRDRRPAAASPGEAVSNSRGRGDRPSRPDRSPFEMKESGALTLGAEVAPSPGRGDSGPDSDQRRESTGRQRTGRSGSGGERRSRSRSRAPIADKSRPTAPPPEKSTADRGHSERPTPKPPAERPTPDRGRPDQSAPKPPTSEPTADRGRTESSVAPEPRPERESNVPAEGRLSPSVVARELARVSSQLRAPEEPKAAEPPAKPVEPEPRASEPTPREGEPQTHLELPAPASRRSEEAPSEPERLEPEAQPRSERPEPATTPEPEPADEPIAFGRSRRHKGAALKKEVAQRPKDATDSTEPEETPSPVTDEEISFGRAKKKRVRK